MAKPEPTLQEMIADSQTHFEDAPEMLPDGKTTLQEAQAKPLAYVQGAAPLSKLVQNPDSGRMDPKAPAILNETLKGHTLQNTTQREALAPGPGLPPKPEEGEHMWEAASSVGAPATSRSDVVEDRSSVGDVGGACCSPGGRGPALGSSSSRPPSRSSRSSSWSTPGRYNAVEELVLLDDADLVQFEAVVGLGGVNLYLAERGRETVGGSSSSSSSPPLTEGADPRIPPPPRERCLQPQLGGSGTRGHRAKKSLLRREREVQIPVDGGDQQDSGVHRRAAPDAPYEEEQVSGSGHHDHFGVTPASSPLPKRPPPPECLQKKFGFPPPEGADHGEAAVHVEDNPPLDTEEFSPRHNHADHPLRGPRSPLHEGRHRKSPLGTPRERIGDSMQQHLPGVPPAGRRPAPPGTRPPVQLAIGDRAGAIVPVTPQGASFQGKQLALKQLHDQDFVPAAGSGPRLPRNWEMHISSDGKLYYVNSAADLTQWEIPELPPPWREIVAHGGGVYYWNADTNKTQWEWPQVKEEDAEEDDFEEDAGSQLSTEQDLEHSGAIVDLPGAIVPYGKQVAPAVQVEDVLAKAEGAIEGVAKGDQVWGLDKDFRKWHSKEEEVMATRKAVARQHRTANQLPGIRDFVRPHERGAYEQNWDKYHDSVG